MKLLFGLRPSFCILVCPIACFYVGNLEARVDGDRVIADVTFRAPSLETSGVVAGRYHIAMPDTVSFGIPGYPVLPVKRLLMVVPEGKTVSDLVVIPGNKIAFPGFYPIEPGQSIRPVGIAVAEGEPSSEVYGTDAPYPGQAAKVATIQKKTGYTLVAVAVFPVEYNPKKQTISYYDRMQIVLNLTNDRKVSLRHEAGNISRRTSARAMSRDISQIRELVENKEDVQVPYTALRTARDLQPSAIGPIPGGQYDYVIITSSALAAAFEPLRAFRAERGLTAAIVTTDWIYTNYPGTRPSGGEDDATRIRNFITDAYHIWGTQFVLLGGSAHKNVGATPIIPVRGLSDPATGADPTQNYQDNDIAADLYYACLDGTFDANANGIYGEPNDGEDGGEVDLLAEVDVGRAPVSNPREASTFVNKTIAYESASLTEPWLENNYMLGVNFLGVDSTAATYSTALMEQVRLGSESGLPTRGFLSNPDRAMEAWTLYDRPGFFWSAPDLIAIINRGVHILNFDGHGNNYSDMRLAPSDLDSISNTMPFIVFSGACYSASFDNRRADLGYNHGTSIAEQLLTKPAGGAVAYVGNSRFGWDFTTEFYNRTFWNVLFSQGVSQLGRMNQLSKEMTLPYFYFPLMRWVYLDQNLLGDPALSVHVPGRLVIEPVSQSLEFQGLDAEIKLTVGLTVFNQNAQDVIATLRTSDPNVIIEQGTAVYGSMAKGELVQGSAAPGFSFRLAPSVKLPYTVEFAVDISADGYASQKIVRVLVSAPSNPPVVNFFLFETGAANNFARSNSRRVGLLFDTTVSNPGLSGGGRMQFSNDGANWSAAEPFVQTKLDWELSPGDGLKIVYARFADAQGDWSQPASSPLILDTTPPVGTIAVQDVTASAVNLCLSAQDLTTGVQAMKFSFDGVRWCPEMLFATSKTLQIPALNPPVDTVYVKFRDLAGNWSSDYSASIHPARSVASLGIQSKSGNAVTLTMALTAGSIYQLQSSSDLVSWTPVGLPFVATAPSLSRETTPGETSCYWRIVQVDQLAGTLP